MKSPKGEMEKMFDEMKSPKGEMKKMFDEMKSPKGEKEKMFVEMKSPKGETEKMFVEMKSPKGETEKRFDEMKSPKGEMEKRFDEMKSEIAGAAEIVSVWPEEMISGSREMADGRRMPVISRNLILRRESVPQIFSEWNRLFLNASPKAVPTA